MAQRTLVKVLVPVAVVAALAFAFWRSVHSARSGPYTLTRASQGAWRVALVPTPAPNEPALVLEPPPELPRELFDQVFKRSMESMRAPELPGIPLVLESELARMGAARPTPEALLAMATAAGLESGPPRPRCVGHRRASEPNPRAQIYFAIFDVQGYDAFRADLVKRGATLDPGVAWPVMVLGVVESPLSLWRPLHVDDEDCVAPINVGEIGAP